MKQAKWIVLISAGCVVGCAAPERAPTPIASVEASTESDVPTRHSSPDVDSLDWSRLEAAVLEAARDQQKKIAPERLRGAALAYALEINRTPRALLRQYHVDRAATVLEREVFSGVTLAEGAALRATVRGGSAGSSRSIGTRGGQTREIGRTGSSRTSTGPGQ